MHHTIWGWNDKDLDDDLFVDVHPINYEAWSRNIHTFFATLIFAIALPLKKTLPKSAMREKVIRRANLNCCLFARLLQVVNIYKANGIIRTYVLLCDKILLYRLLIKVRLNHLSTFDNKRKWYKLETYGLISQRQLSRFPVRDVHRGQEKMWKYKRIDWFVVIDKKMNRQIKRQIVKSANRQQTDRHHEEIDG